MTIGALTPQALSDALVELIDDLRDREYSLTIRHYVALHDLVMLLLSRKGTDTDLLHLQTLFGPVLCATPYEQARFPGIFQDWVNRLAARAKDDDAVPDRRGAARWPDDVGRSRNINRELDDIEKQAKKTQTRLAWIAAAVVLALLAASVGYLRWM